MGEGREKGMDGRWEKGGIDIRDGERDRWEIEGREG